jgi:hypothetical protein
MRVSFYPSRGALLPRLCAIAIISAAAILPGFPGEEPSVHAEKTLRPDSSVRKALAGITPSELKSDLSFLASDALAGRDTPSQGLEVAAEFIASRFRAAGLEAPVNDTYFQIADLTEYARQMAERYHRQPKPQVVGRNVIGILCGSDPVLRNTYVLVTAHYDHIGTLETVQGRTREKPSDTGDHIYNGADDDGSGTVSVIALARALAQVKQRPKRSIIFLTFCGEELGLLGSRYYAEHPVVPLKQTIADLNLEQVGRTDGDIKPRCVSLTGFSFTTLGSLLKRAGITFGLQVQQHEKGDKYFAASDNFSLAKYGVPANTLCTAFEFPDYHGLKDEWPKIDYENLAVVNEVVGTVIWKIADDRTVPLWNASLPKTEAFRKAARETYGCDLSIAF